MSIEKLFQRYRGSLQQFVKFGLIGGAGVFVNQFALVVITVVFRDFFSIGWGTVFFPIPMTPFSIRYYHVFVLFSFVVANLFNFVLNRHWTFKSGEKAPFLREYFPFLAVGSVAQGVGLIITTLLVHPNSPFMLPDAVFDGSSGLRDKLYWANLIQIVLVMPINFVVNKLWTFRAIRNRYGANGN